MRDIPSIKKLAIVLVVTTAMASLFSCSKQAKVITAASEAINQRDYNQTLNTILELNDDDILKSDTLMQLLSTAYYGKQLKPQHNVAIDCYDFDITPSGDAIIFTDFHNGSLNVYSYPELKLQRTILLPTKAYNIDISPNGTILAAAMADNTVILYDLSSGQKLKVLEGHTNRVRDVKFRDEGFLFSCSNDQKIAAWDVATGEPHWGKHQHSKNIKNLQLSNDGTKLITASNDGTASILTAVGENVGAEELRVIHGDNYVNDAAVTPDNKYLVTVSGDGYAKIWNAEDGRSEHYLFLNDPLGAVDISDNGKLILVGGRRFVYVIETGTGNVVVKIPGSNKPIWSVKFIDNSHFAFADNSRFWQGEILTGEKLLTAAKTAN